MFELDFGNEEDVRSASTIILVNQRKNLEKTIGVGE